MNASSPRRRTRAAVVTALAALSVVGIGAASASAANGFTFSPRVGGAGRVDTAVAVSQQLYPGGGATDVVLVNQTDIVDGLSASYLAGLKNAPILYTASDTPPSTTMAEIKRLGVKNIWLVGGNTVISDDQMQWLTGQGFNVVRKYGADRYGTAAAIAEAGPYQPERVLLASGTSLADAVTVSPLAWARNYPILLTTASGAVPKATSDALAQLGTTSRTVIGGTAVVSDDTYKALGATSRDFGPTRQGTAVAVADDEVANAGFTYGNAAIVGGADSNEIDALSASSLAGDTGTPLLFTEGSALGGTTTAYLQKHSSDLVKANNSLGLVFGGTIAVPDSVVAQANAAAG